MEMTMSQPQWKFVAQLGDVDPIEHGGYFIFVDETGVYAPEAELLEVIEEGDEISWEVRRFILEPCTYIDGILSDNKFHPQYPAWFATPEPEKAKRPQDTTYLSNIASCQGLAVEELIKQFCSTDPIQRAWAYRAVGEYHGFANLDEYPLVFTDEQRSEVEERYKECVA